MSGGYFNYKQSYIYDILEEIQNELDIQGKEIPRENLYFSDEYYENNPEAKIYPTHSIEVQEKFKEAIKLLKAAAVYTQRIDYFLEGDDSEKNFLKRLDKDLKKI